MKASLKESYFGYVFYSLLAAGFFGYTCWQPQMFRNLIVSVLISGSVAAVGSERLKEVSLKWWQPVQELVCYIVITQKVQSVPAVFDSSLCLWLSQEKHVSTYSKVAFSLWDDSVVGCPAA